MYNNNRSVSYARNGTLHIKPAFVADAMSLASADLSLWGGDPSTACTNNFDYGCERVGGANIINPIASAALRTAETLSLRYGRVEIVAQLPRGDWLWPALWMMPTESAYGAWPASGEIDIAESRGNAASYAAGGVNEVSSTLHYGPYCCECVAARPRARATAAERLARSVCVRARTVCVLARRHCRLSCLALALALAPLASQ